MKWTNIYSGEWIRRFALFPENVSGQTVWMEHYWERYVSIPTGCECRIGAIGRYERATSLPPANSTQPLTTGGKGP